jgi:small subunit ribosomal protein S7
VSRRKKTIRRPVLPDARYDSQTVSKFINSLMYQGKKAVAERIFYGAMDLVESRTSQPGVNVFKQALSNLKPVVEVKSRRVGGANYQVPVEVRPVRRMALAMRWLREAAKKRSEKSMPQRLAGELLEAAEGRGGAMKKREEVHRMAEANKAFAHFRF